LAAGGGRRANERRSNSRILVNRSVLAALVVACARETLPAQGNPPARPTLAPARLAGVIKDSLDKPIAEAEVFLRDVGRGTRTNARGEFTLGDVPPETYEVWFRRLGYESAQYTWSARAGERTEVKVMLHLLPRSLDPVVVRAKEEKTIQGRSRSTRPGRSSPARSPRASMAFVNAAPLV
jgi:hypothetical protein